MNKIDKFLDLMFWSIGQTHIWHLQTTDMTMHDILREYYEEMTDDADEFAEMYIGANDKILKVSEDIKFSNLEGVNMVKKHFKDIVEYLDELIDELEGDTCTRELKDMKADISGFMFKLRMVDGYKTEEKKDDDKKDDKDEKKDEKNDSIKQIEDAMKPKEEGKDKKESKDDFIKRLLGYSK